MTGWAAAFLFTQCVEAPLYWAAQRGLRRGALVRLAVALGASALTHPAVYHVFPRWWPGGYWAQVSAAEAFAVAMEAAWLAVWGVRHPLRWALLANALSAGLGLASRGMWGWP